MMGKSAFFSEGTAGQMKSAPSFAKDDDSTLPKEPNGSKIRLGPKPIWGMSVYSGRALLSKSYNHLSFCRPMRYDSMVHSSCKNLRAPRKIRPSHRRANQIQNS